MTWQLVAFVAFLVLMRIPGHWGDNKSESSGAKGVSTSRPGAENPPEEKRPAWTFNAPGQMSRNETSGMVDEQDRFELYGLPVYPFGLGTVDSERNERPRFPRRAIRGPFTEDDKKKILEYHNKVRSEAESAADMIKLVWDKDLEKDASAQASKCNWQHAPRSRKVGRFNDTGDNLGYTIDLSSDVNTLTKSWEIEKLAYTYSRAGLTRCKPGMQCGHYTLMTWSISEAVGCAFKHCPVMQNAADPAMRQGYLYICMYGPGGNVNLKYPWRKGSACSKCSSKYKGCVDNLCTVSDTKAGSGSVLPALIFTLMMTFVTSTI